MNPVTFNCTVLRDGHQSLAATRMKTEDMLPIAPILDSMGFSALETWGGATIDAGLRFLKEWPLSLIHISSFMALTPPSLFVVAPAGYSLMPNTSSLSVASSFSE